MAEDISSIPNDVFDRLRLEQERGVSDKALLDVGEFVPGTSQLRFEDAARVMVEVPHSMKLLPGEDEETERIWVEPSDIATPKPYKGDAFEGDLNPGYHQEVMHLSPEVKAIGKAGVAGARESLAKIPRNL